eukprot:130062-Prymnesium_polylepis.1
MVIWLVGVATALGFAPSFPLRTHPFATPRADVCARLRQDDLSSRHWLPRDVRANHPQSQTSPLIDYEGIRAEMNQLEAHSHELLRQRQELENRRKTLRAELKRPLRQKQRYTQPPSSWRPGHTYGAAAEVEEASNRNGWGSRSAAERRMLREGRGGRTQQNQLPMSGRPMSGPPMGRPMQPGGPVPGGPMPGGPMPGGPMSGPPMGRPMQPGGPMPGGPMPGGPMPGGPMSGAPMGRPMPGGPPGSPS